MKTGKCAYMNTYTIPMVIHCNNKVWCSECNDRCEEYTENQKKFFEIIIEKQKQQREEKTKMTKQDTMEIHITPGMIPTTEEDNMLTQMGELQETIDMLGEHIIELTKDEELKKLEKQMEKIQNKINERKLEIGITSTTEERNELMNTLQNEIDMFAMKIDEARWGPNQFTKGKKKEFSSKNGTISILKSTRTVRKINTKKLLDINPLFIQKLAEEGRLGVTLAEAEKDMSKNEIDEVADKTVTATYELYVKRQGPK